MQNIYKKTVINFLNMYYEHNVGKNDLKKRNVKKKI